ncbi:glycosyltransferase family 39 protein [Neolewinella aurantiaca]|uniref:Glycosyltransferase family 39 protein n=1 Tax=Neolewinella aurantiaca TaxID=2602767 RepID=A0A5C7FIK1_9BACT|nr:glycosyltransferase family 39 protein [Neolewinella aurantiaca]TXF89669.1 glycosyltransferase family 39 protein [Neolewinella aurantiaca]
MGKYKWLLILLILAVVARWGTFFISVINHDESTYIVIADEMLRGEIYLQDVVDTKPIGIFWIYAALIKLTGGSIIALRAAATAVVALGGWGLFLAGRRATGHEQVGAAAGVIYIFICSLFTYYGISPNTEIFFNLFTIAAVALAVAPRVNEGSADPVWHWPVAGFLLGLAVIIKPFAAAEALAVGLFMVWYYAQRQAFGRMLGSGTLLVAFFTLPLLYVYGYYYRLGLLDQLAFYTFEVSSAYPIELPWYLRLKYMGDYLLRFSPFVILGAGALVQWKKQKSRAGIRWWSYLLLQFLLVTVVVLLTGKRFGHYQIQLHPVLALLAACWWTPGFPSSLSIIKRWWARRKNNLSTNMAPSQTGTIFGGARAWWTVAVLALLLGGMHFSRYSKKDDYSKELATYLNANLGPEETFFLLNGHQITYHLTGRNVPTPYVHSSLLFLDHHVRAFQVDEIAEANRIIDDEQVTLLVGREDDEEIEGALGQRILTAFEPVDSIGGELVIYRRK